HWFNCEFWRLQPELASGGFCSLEYYSFSRIEHSYDRVKLSREAESMPEYDKLGSLCIIKPPARIATDSGWNGNIPVAIASALTYSKHSENKNLVIIPGKL